jgi:hypothetical protein
MSEIKIRKTPMQELIDVILRTKEMMSKDDKFKDLDFSMNADTVISLLNNSYEIEEAILSSVFDYAFLQAELKEKAEVTSGREYVNKFFKKNENISS